MLDKFIGGWQIAGTGYWRSAWATLPTNYWPTGQALEIYGQKYPITDCRSGACYPGYLYFNGYIPANRINSYDANGKPNGVMGVPADYKPAVAPPDYVGTNRPAGECPGQYQGIHLLGYQQRMDPSEQRHHPQRTHVQRQHEPVAQPVHPRASTSGGWTPRCSSSFPIRERVTLRFNIDFFNALNHPNNPTSCRRHRHSAHPQLGQQRARHAVDASPDVVTSVSLLGRPSGSPEGLFCVPSMFDSSGVEVPANLEASS